MEMKNKEKTSKPIDYVIEYNKIFHIIGLDPSRLNHQWKKDGDLIKEYNLNESLPTPIITQDTFSINY